MANIPIRDIPGAVQTAPSPIALLPMDNGTAMEKTTVQAIVDSGAPVASKGEAEAGIDNSKRMTALRVKESIAAEVGITIASSAQGDKADSAVQPSRTISAGTGLVGGGDLSANRSFALSTTALASLALADTAVQPSRAITAGAGLTGGGDLSADRTISLSTAAQASLALADTAVQPGDAELLPAGGSTGQVLVKATNDDYDTEWVTSEAATAVSYAPQSLTESQKSQARDNIGAGNSVSFSVRNFVNASLAAARLDGSITWIAGQPYKTDSSATGAASLTSDLGVDGLVPVDRVTPRMCGAAGDGATDDAAAVQKSWIMASVHRVPCYMEGLEYNCSTEITTRSNLTVYAGGAKMYVTAYNPVGGFVHNVVRNNEAARVQSNIRIYDLITDGSKLPDPTPGQNENMNLGPEFAWGASNVRVVNCIAQNIDFGFGGGTGGGGLGGEQGLDDVQFIGCIAKNCYRGVRVAAQQGTHPLGALKGATNVVFRDFTAIRCGTAVFAHSLGSVGTQPHSMATFEVVFDGVKAVDCGHMPWTPVDYGANPAISPQKTGVFTLAGAHNILFRGVRVLQTTDFTSTPDWKGRSGYPASGNFVGAGLSGNVGALVWGWGRNTVFEDITLDGPVDTLWKCGRAVAFGELASSAPTAGAVGGAPGDTHIEIRHIRYVRNIVVDHIFDAMTGLDGAKFNGFMRVTMPAATAGGFIGPNGTAGLNTLTLEMESLAGAIQRGSAAQWLARGNILKTGAQTFSLGGGIDLGGGYSSVGGQIGATYDASAGVWRSSVTSAASSPLYAFYNTNGLVGSISVTGSATAYNTSSDARLKDDPRDFDALGMLNLVKAYDFAWNKGGRGFGVFAQELQEVFPDAVTEGDSDEDWNAKAEGERVHWSVDYSKLVPILIKAIQQLNDRLTRME